MTEPNGIVALHGFTGRGSDFAPLQALCPESGHWCSPDLPGHGPSPSGDCGPQAAIDCINRAAGEYPHCRILLGYSMGGRAALLHALSRPDRWDGLVLIGTNPGISNPVQRSNRAKEDAILAQRIQCDGLDAFLRHWQEQPLIASQSAIDPEWRAGMQAARMKHSACGLAQSLRQFGQGSIPDLWPELSTIRCPVLLLTGALDQKYTAIAEKMLPLLPAAIHRILPAAGHMAHIESPGAAADAIRTFLREFA